MGDTDSHQRVGTYLPTYSKVGIFFLEYVPLLIGDKGRVAQALALVARYGVPTDTLPGYGYLRDLTYLTYLTYKPRYRPTKAQGVESPTTGGGKQRPSTATSSRLHPDYCISVLLTTEYSTQGQGHSPLSGRWLDLQGRRCSSGFKLRQRQRQRQRQPDGTTKPRGLLLHRYLPSLTNASNHPTLPR